MIKMAEELEDNPLVEAENPLDESAEPDPDTIKMFVGQIPRSWTEADCRKLFEEFGRVHQLNILRDKTTQSSKGCCFVTYYRRQDAITAQDKLHNIRILPQMNHAIQMKPADLENRNERKLFVGMLNRTMDEEDVKEMFKEFGQIEECTVLRDEVGKSRGCAFVTFVSRAFAHNAIRQMHQSRTMEGCSKPIVVKFADSQRDKDKKGGNPPAEAPDQNGVISQLLHQKGNAPLEASLATQLVGLNTLLQQPGILNLIGTVISSLTGPNSGTAVPMELNASTSQHTASSKSPDSVSGSGEASTSGPMPNLLQQQSMVNILQQQGIQKDANFNIPTVGYAQNGGGIAHSFHTPTSGPILSFGSPNFGASSYEEALLKTGSYSTFPSNFPTMDTTFGQQIPTVNSLNLLAQQRAAVGAAVPAGNAQSKGPDGCNLFVYHLPQDFQDADLYNLFSHFGNILSVKVFIDKETNLSKCFGFISYDNVVSAQNAISAMNGFQVNSKRLKVQLKRQKPSPYQ